MKRILFCLLMLHFSTYIAHPIDRNLPLTHRARAGEYTIYVRPKIDKTGQLTNIAPQTKFGFEMDEEVVKMLKRAPNCIPAK